jgi:hypothetical protein
MGFEKKNHHYVPQFWQKGFKGQNGRLYGRNASKIKIVSTKYTMQGDWIYTIFDEQWNPSDDLENKLSIEEGKISKLFSRIGIPANSTTADDRAELCSAIALQACRHPDVMGRVPRKGVELGTLLADAHKLNEEDFVDKVGQLGIDPAEAVNMYNALIAVPEAQLAAELDELKGLSPQDPQLPIQEALLAKAHICSRLKTMHFTLLDAPQGAEFVLGDTPVPQQDLLQGFSVPISKSVAVLAQPAISPQNIMSRRVATQQEVDEINKIQWENALETVVGSNETILKTL